MEDVVVFTITKYMPENGGSSPKKLIVKRKSFNEVSTYSVCQFDDFESFCQFCNRFKSLHKANDSKLAKHIALYFWKDNYYLVLRNVNTKSTVLKLFYSSLSEFRKASFLFFSF